MSQHTLHVVPRPITLTILPNGNTSFSQSSNLPIQSVSPIRPTLDGGTPIIAPSTVSSTIPIQPLSSVPSTIPIQRASTTTLPIQGLSPLSSTIPIQSFTPVTGHSNLSTTQMPSFNHTPITPIIVPKMTGLTLEEKEARRLAGQRERANRYREKVREYTKIGTLDTDREKIYSLLILCDPELVKVNKVEIEMKIDAFLESLRELT